MPLEEGSMLSNKGEEVGGGISSYKGAVQYNARHFYLQNGVRSRLSSEKYVRAVQNILSDKESTVQPA